MQRKRNHKRRGLWLAAAVCATLLLSAPEAFAYNFEDPDTLGYSGGRPEVCPGEGLAARMVRCIKETILTAVYRQLTPFSAMFAGVVGACGMLAILFWALKMATGRRNAPVRDAFVGAVKLMFVTIFTASFGASYFGGQGGLFGLLLDAMEGMLSMLTGYMSFSSSIPCDTHGGGSGVVWQRLDCAVQSILGGILPIQGVAPRDTIYFGIVGFLIVSLFSGAAGFFIGLMGLWIIVQLLMAMARAMYIFITSYVAFALMVLVSPMFIPLLLFGATKSFFDKWLKLTLGFILQPIFLFAYLSLLLAAFDAVMYSGSMSLFRNIAGDAVNSRGFQVGDWLHSNRVYVNASKGAVGMQMDWRRALNRIGAPGNTDTGVFSVLGEHLADPSVWDQQGGVFAFLNPGGARNFFRVDTPTKEVDWDQLAYLNNQGNGSYGDPGVTTDYIIKLFLSFIMALVMTYIFIAMLDTLPFIGSGITGEVFSMPAFGKGMLGMPGEKAADNLGARLSQYFQGRNPR